MDKEEILQMEPGRELDCLVLEKVLGYKMIELHPEWYPLPVKCFYLPEGGHVQYSYDGNACNARMFRNGENDCDGIAESVPHYSTDISASWNVVDKMQNTSCKDGDHFVARVEGITHKHIACFFHHLAGSPIDGGSLEYFEAEAKTAPEAICKAALLAHANLS